MKNTTQKNPVGKSMIDCKDSTLAEDQFLHKVLSGKAEKAKAPKQICEKSYFDDKQNIIENMRFSEREREGSSCHFIIKSGREGASSFFRWDNSWGKWIDILSSTQSNHEQKSFVWILIFSCLLRLSVAWSNEEDGWLVEYENIKRHHVSNRESNMFYSIFYLLCYFPLITVHHSEREKARKKIILKPISFVSCSQGA